jgi:hypothetical protein
MQEENIKKKSVFISCFWDLGTMEKSIVCFYGQFD